MRGGRGGEGEGLVEIGTRGNGWGGEGLVEMGAVR